MRRFEYLDHTADVGLRAFGATPEEALENAALALFSLVEKPEKVEPAETWEIAVEGAEMDDLLFEWLNELIFLMDAKDALGREARVVQLGHNEDYHLKAAVTGEVFDPARHQADAQPKAATYHMLKLEQEPDKTWVAQAILDV